MRKAIIIFIAIVSLTNFAAGMDGKSLRNGLKESFYLNEKDLHKVKNRPMALASVAYVTGVYRSARYYEGVKPTWNIHFPEPYDVDTACAVVHEYLDANPQQLHLDSWLLTMHAFQQAWGVKADK